MFCTYSEAVLTPPIAAFLGTSSVPSVPLSPVRQSHLWMAAASSRSALQFVSDLRGMVQVSRALSLAMAREGLSTPRVLGVQGEKVSS